MIDIHSHIIPAVDDGCKDEAMALKMLRKAAASGTRAIFATSHVLSAGEHPSWEKLQAGVEWLRGACRDNDIDLQIYSGAEVFMDWELLDELAVNGSYCLNGEAFGKQAVTYMLVELPMHFLPQYADDFWYELRLKGVVPILAHPERYPELMAKTERLLTSGARKDCCCNAMQAALPGGLARAPRGRRSCFYAIILSTSLAVMRTELWAGIQICARVRRLSVSWQARRSAGAFARRIPRG